MDSERTPLETLEAMRREALENNPLQYSTRTYWLTLPDYTEGAVRPRHVLAACEKVGLGPGGILAVFSRDEDGESYVQYAYGPGEWLSAEEIGEETVN